MSKPELVLSNTTTFFSGNIESVFRKAKKYGFKFLEILPYRWTTPQQILRLSQKYNIQIAGIHMPEWWNIPLSQIVKQRENVLQKILMLVWNFYLGSGIKNSGIAIVETLMKNGQNPPPYVLFHSNLVSEMGTGFDLITKRFHTVIENLPYQKNHDAFYWDPLVIKKYLLERKLQTGLVFDPGHFMNTMKKQPKLNLDILNTYKQTRAEIIHISYDKPGVLHALPNKQEQYDLIRMLKLHTPRYIVIETNPLVNVGKAKKLLEKIIQESANA